MDQRELRELLVHLEAATAGVRKLLAEGVAPRLFEAPAAQSPITAAYVNAAWERARAVANRAGGRWRSDLGNARRQLILGVLRRYPKIELSNIVRGYLRLSADWSAEFRERCLAPEYVFRTAKVESHIEAWEQAWIANPAVPAAPQPDVRARTAEAEELRTRGTFGSIGGA